MIRPLPIVVMIVAVAILASVARRGKASQAEPPPPRLRGWVNPVWFWFGNPVFRREMLTGLRSSRLRWILLVYVVVPFAVIASVWPTNATFYGGSDLAIGVWRRYLESQMWLVALMTPVFAAYTVSSEFQQDTAELLWTSLVPARAIVAGKMVAVVLLCVGLLTASLASLSLVFYLGGVGVREILDGFVLLICMVLLTASIAVFYSTKTRKGHMALLFTYLTFLALPCTLGPSFGALMVANTGLGAAWLLPLIASVVFVVAALRSADKPVGEPTRPNFIPIDDPRQIRQRRRNWPYYLVDPMRRSPPLPDGGNVIAYQDPRMHPLQRSEWGYRAAAVTGALTAVLVIGPLADRSLAENDGLCRFIWWLNFITTATWTVLLHAVSMTMDQEMGTLEGVRLTSIGPREFLFGKWLGSLRMRWILITIGVVGVALVNVAARRGAANVLLMPLAWWCSVELCGLAAFAMSSLCSRTMSAVAMSLASGLALVAGGMWLKEARFDADWEPAIRRVILAGGPSKLDAFKLIVVLLVAFALWLLADIGVRRKWRQER